MMVHKLTVAGNELFLDQTQDVEQTKTEIVDAVKRGGGIVDVVVAGHTTVSVLVSQRMPVTFETIDAREPEADRAGHPDSDAVVSDADAWNWDDLSI